MALAPRTVQNMPDRFRREPITVLPPAFAVRRKWGPWPGSPAFAQWQFGLLQRHMTPRIEPGRKSPNCVIWRTTSERSFSKTGSDSDMKASFVLAYHIQ